MRLADELRLATWTSGRPRELPAVVLVHGGPGLWDYLEPLASMLDDLTVVHRYDQRGCGRSDRAGPYSVTWSVADLEQLRRHWGHERWVVVGHSYGATLGLAYAATHPGRAAALGYVNGVGIGDWRTPFRAERRRRQAAFGPRLAELDALTRRSREEEVEWRRLGWATDYADTERGMELALPMAQEPWEINHEANRLTAFCDADCRAWAQTVRCPVTVVHGAADPRPAAHARMLADLMPTARWHLLDRAGHLPWAEAPDEVASILRGLLVG